MNLKKHQANSPPIFLSVVIPCYNEEAVIQDTLGKVTSYLGLKGYMYEIIVVDDASTDTTTKIAKRMAMDSQEIQVLQNDKNNGKGASVKKGLLRAKGQFVCFSDADLSTPIEEVDKLLAELYQGYDIAIGSRGLKESVIQIHQPWYRERMGKTFNLLIQIFTLRGIKDTQCGFKCFRKEIINDICSMQQINGFSFDVEILYIARKLGYRIKEVPIRWYNNPTSRVNPFLDPFKMMFDLFRIKINDWKGRY